MSKVVESKSCRNEGRRSTTKVGRLDHDVHGAYGGGVMVGGMPVGDAAYVDEAVRVLGEGIESYIDTTVTQLQLHPYHLAASLYHAAQHRFMYWLRHLPPLLQHLPGPLFV